MRRADLVARFSQAVDVEKAESLVDKGARTVGLPSTETYTSQNVADICEAIEQQTEGYLRLLATEIRVSERTQERFDALLEQVTDPVVTVRFEDETPVVAAMNPAFRETFGYGSAAIDQRLDDLIVPEDVAEPVEPWLSPHTGDGQEAQRLTDDGERRTFLLRTVVVTRETGRVEGYGIYTDITERKEPERRYEAVFNNTYQFMGLLESDGTVLKVNEPAREFGDLAPEKVGGRRVWETSFIAWSEVTQARTMRAVERAATGEFVRHELEVMGADGKATIDFSVRPVLDDTGDVELLVIEGRDITGERQRRARHERQREALVELATDQAVATGDLGTALHRITETAADVLDVPRVNVWMVEDQGGATLLDCVDHYDRTMDAHTSGMDLATEEYPEYFEALESHRAIDAVDARSDPRTAELTDDYLEVHDIGAVLDATIRSVGETIGVVCHEHVGGTREWTDDEVDFASDIADIVHRALRNHERKERKLELERYETMLNRAGDIVYATDPDGYLTAVNDAATAFLGYSREEVVGAHVSLVMDDTDVATGEAIIQELLADEDRDEGVFEMNLVTRDGERIPCEDHIQVLVSDGEFQGVVGVVRDITERKEYENTLEALHATTRALFRCETRDEVAQQTAAAAKSVLGYPTNVVRLCSADGTSLQPVAVTEDAKAVYGKRPTYAVGEGPVGEVYASGRTRVCEDVQQLDDGFDRGDARAGLYVSLGEYGALSINSRAVDAFDQTDVQLAELLATNVEAALDRAADERELRERTQELRRQNERLDKFASVLSHDLRNPLNVAQGRLDLAQRECDSEHLDSVAQAHDRMDTLIQDVLTLTREGRSVGETTTVSVATVAEAAWDHVETDEATVEITGSQEIKADESRLRQLFENLFRNAVEHAGNACTVSVGTLDDPPGFYVADDGPGIPPDESDTVFDSGYSTASEGTGFGLSIVKQIAEAHGWEVNVTASDRGGARFEICGTSSANQQDD
ncbi:PAS domain S-box protein [Halopenitus persicus]|uniref:histidine kinase n=1 Tax=Halopenitus persicus TaxID=1048396 RepID=A0A1H3LJU0_9EURY|nr:PAS domain S-box protein [Halopenitus persicus]SDY64797.1 PAS domain S-box-containing protein [Halopenitus persicus]